MTVRRCRSSVTGVRVRIGTIPDVAGPVSTSVGRRAPLFLRRGEPSYEVSDEMEILRVEIV